MADPEHFEIIKRGSQIRKQGMLEWNEWRWANPEVRPDLSGADLYNGYLGGADLSGADLSRATLTFAELIWADLSHADFNHARLDGADLSNTDLSNADLRGANLHFTILAGADLSGTDFTGADMGFTIFGDVDLSRAKGLEETAHLNPSIIDIKTVYRSQGNIHEVFLRRAGVPEDFITYMRSLAVQPIQFYTCFISFTEADDTFSERLYNDLQAKGVRCWRWKEDAQWGKALMRSIDEAVRVYDKLIVICSEQSLNSPAVIREIERALQKEDDLARQVKDDEVLFPIRLDDYIFNGWQHHRKADVTAKNVGDFRRWKQHDFYQKAFDRLLRDLKAEA